ncbi:Inositol 2-dehydrogenase [Aquisphaera giovannonii]|uniref:Inositol 2-dehydrogenase n=1 Tax=Aquisphaera giovannonii TaxID=406548 RepID=A0A5B9W0W9_9BACT|nr:Gfo/Idh/MocA family oxidoreductase [Aquisphaera giovannonii]QEH34266.1 Inositol 2-dehydrogenase [Aquisphaera giovannonii]
MKRSNAHADGGASRRHFFRQASTGLAGAAVASAVPLVHAGSGEDARATEIKIGLIGCGGRGTGAVLNALGAATKVIYPSAGYHTEDAAEGAKVSQSNIKVVALADLFDDRLEKARGELAKVGVEVNRDRCFTGFEAYKKLLEVDEVNYVIQATPPHFRPAHLMAAIQAGKHAFIEKPAAVDVPGVHLLIEAGELAARKNLGIAAGTQRRHQKSYIETIRRIRDGAIGDVVYAKAYWNGGQIWVVDKESSMSEMEWQLRNWNYFTWLSGDHIVEQHVHNLDVMNWVLGSHPVKAVSALGGRQARHGERQGHIYDHFAVEFEYPGGITVFSQCRQISNCDNLVGESVVGTKGTSNCADRIDPKGGSGRWRYRGPSPNPYDQEHQDLIASILAGRPINEARAIAESTLTGILGREAAYSGRAITWEEALRSRTRLGPAEYRLGPAPFPPVAIPGQYRFV